MAVSYTSKYKKNIKLLQHLDAEFPNDYYDWKITIIFYICILKLKQLALNKGLDIGTNHKETLKKIDPFHPERTMPIGKTAFENYKILLENSHNARYNGYDNEEIYNNEQKINLYICLEKFEKLDKYFSDNNIF